jgi:hypothetical protein
MEAISPSFLPPVARITDVARIISTPYQLGIKCQQALAAWSEANFL